MAYTTPATLIVLIDARPQSEKTPKTEFYDYPGFYRRLGDNQYQPPLLNVLSHALAQSLPAGTEVTVEQFEIRLMAPTLGRETMRNAHAGVAASISPIAGAIVGSQQTDPQAVQQDGVWCAIKLSTDHNRYSGTWFVPAPDELREFEGPIPKPSAMSGPITTAVRGCVQSALKSRQ